MQAQLIALDWGTSSLRAYLLGPDGHVLDQRSLDRGIMQLSDAPRLIAGHSTGNGFELALDEACGDWLDACPALPIIACGMVGSAQGWQEAPYCPCPARATDVAAGIIKVHSLRGVDIHLVPGVIQHSALPNVMRGEETQIFGLLGSLPAGSRDRALLIGLPGSHSKWTRVAEQRIEHFDTFMTGELFAAVCAHTILGRTQQRGGPFDVQAFERGVSVALSEEGRIGMLSTLFSARTLGLTGQLPAAQQADYLSGLMIGHELRALAEVLRLRSGQTPLPPVVLIGNDSLCQRYEKALALCAFPSVRQAEQATEKGLWSLAVAAGLVAQSLQEV
jgi:2-dehydro-3-deoxygalactonokinase